MNDREREIMVNVVSLCEQQRANGWRIGAKPLDCGGTNGSYHSATMMRMQKKGWLEYCGYGHSTKGGGRRRVCIYKATADGLAALIATGWKMPTLRHDKGALW